MSNIEIPRQFWGKLHGEEYFIQGLQDAMSGKQAADPKKINYRYRKAYQAGYDAGISNKGKSEASHVSDL